MESLERRTLLTASPVAWYHFDEGTGTTATDASGNGNTAALVGDASWQSQAVGFTTGTAGADLHLDGAGAADLGNPSDLNFSGQITLSAWFKPISTAGTQDIIAHGYGSAPNGPYAEVFMRISNGNYEVGSSDGSWDYQALMPMPASDVGTWVNLTGVYDGVGWVLYRNGLQVGDQPEAKGSMMVNADWMIGLSAVPSDPRCFSGDIDEVKIFNQALYGQDILDQMGYQFPTLHAAAAAPPIEGQAVTLNLSATYASGVPNTIYSWTVDWGDGTTASPDVQSVSGQSPSPTHTYGIAGNYVVQVTATDAQGIHLLNAAQLDTTFGTGGIATVPSGGWVPMSIITQQGFGSPAQAFYLAAGSINGNFGVARFTTNGILDPNFGTGGVSTISLAGYQLNGETAAMDDQNRILLAGYAAPIGGGMDQFAVARFNFDGTLDATFGTNGLATLGAAGYDDFAFALYPYIDDNGDEKIMLGGRANEQGALVQYNDDGTPDTSFGYGGAIIPGGTMNTIYHLYRLANGQFLGGGFSWGVNGTTDYAAARYNANGTLDTTFGVGGVASANFHDFDIATTMSIGPTGQILLTGYAQLVDGYATADMAMAAFTPDGQPDDSFGANGRVDEYWGPVGFLFGGQYLPDGKILVTGMDNGTVALQRFNADGTVDPTFNGSALSNTWVGGWYYGDQVLIDSNGQALTLGNAGDPLDSWVLTRRLADVTLAVAPAIGDLTATAVSATEIDLTWDNPAPDVTSYEIDRSSDGTNWQILADSLVGTATSYSDTTGLAEATHFYYRVIATRSGYSSEQFTADTWTLANAPSVLAGPGPSAPPSDSSVTLSWTDNSGGLAGTTIYVSTDGVNFSYFDDVAAGQTTYTAEELDADTTYWFYVTSTTPGGDSAPSNTISTTTTSVAAPSNLQVTINSDTDASLQWTDNSSDENGFEIDWSTDGTNFEELDTVGAGTTTYDASSLTPGTSYTFRVSAIADAGQSAEATSSPETTLPPVPTEPSTSSPDDSSISLSWDTVASATTYIVEREGSDGGGWQEVGQTADTSFSDVGLSPATGYQYRLAAVNDTGQSDFGDAASALTRPAAPSDLQAQGKPGGEIDLTWTNNSPTADGIRVLMKSGDHDYASLATLAATASSYNATDLDPDTTYTFKVVAYNAAGDSESATASAQTQSASSGTLSPNDDGWTGPVNVGFELNFLGKMSRQLYINNNGNVNLDAGSSTYTPSSSITTQYGAIIAPFFADVDTRGSSGGTVSYGPNPGPNGQPGFEVCWDEVDYYNATSYSHQSLHDTFSLQITDRSDVAPGDFDIDFHYGTIQWDTGDASGGSGGVSNGIYGHPARIGYSNGTGKSNTWYEVSGSGSPGAFLGEGPGDQHFEIRNPKVSLTAYRTGDNFGAAVSGDVKDRADPSQYVILTNNNFDEHPDMSQPDNADDTALIGADHDLAKITLHKIDPAASDGTVSLIVSDPSSVRLFKDDGTELTETTLDLSNPTGDLAGLLSGDVNVWVEGLKANPDLSIKIAYSDSSGDETSSDTIHMTVADWNFVDKAGDMVTQAGSFDMNNLLTDAQGNPQDPLPADDSEYKVKIDGLAASDVESLQATSVADPTDGYADTLVSNGGSVESADWAVLYHSDQNGDGSDKLLTADQRQEITKDLQLNAVHNEDAYYRLGTAQDEFTRTLPAWKGIYNEKILRAALESDPNYGAAMKFVFDQLDQAKDDKGAPLFTFSVEPLYFRNFDGTQDGIYVDNGATTLAQAKEWAMDAFREWAANNTELSRGADPLNNFFPLLARKWARHFYWDDSLPTPAPLANPDPHAAAVSLGSTLDFLYLFSRDAAGPGSNLEMYTSDLGFINDGVPDIFCWVFSDRPSATDFYIGTKAMVNIPAKLGLNLNFWEADTTGSNKGMGFDPITKTWPSDDQDHHFAAYFEFGARFSWSGNAGLAHALKWTGDYPSKNNPGDYYLGILAYDLGKAYEAQPGFVGQRVMALLGETWKDAFKNTGRSSANLP